VVLDTANRMMVSRVLDRLKAIATGQGEITETVEPELEENTISDNANETTEKNDASVTTDTMTENADKKTETTESINETKQDEKDS